MEVPLQFAFRTQKSIGLFDAAPAYHPLGGFVQPEGSSRCCAYSPCGRYFAWASLDSVATIDTLSGRVLNNFPASHVYEIEFSPKGTFLVTWERPSKDESGNPNDNLKIWVTTGDDHPLGSFVQKSQGGINLQYTADERYCARSVTNEVHFFESLDLVKIWTKLRVEGVSDFALGPGSTNSVAVFIPERKGQPATVQVYNLPQVTSPVSQKTFFKGDKVQLKWNKLGTSLLVLAQTEVDKTNKNYYGETTLYLLSADGVYDARVDLDKEGPIHDVCWSPNSRSFGVVYGYMPSKTTLFNHRAGVTHSFPIGPRNTLIFSPTGRFAIVAGFGNLAGQMDVYDLERDFAKICTIESGSPSVCHWSPDSRFIMTATTSPRLRVDNGVKLWHVSGNLMYSDDMVELYNILWRPALDGVAEVRDPLNPIPPAHSSAVAYLGTKTPVKSTGAYRPPGARGSATPLIFKREDEGGAAHSVGNGTKSIGSNGFGRGRRVIPGADPADSSDPSAGVFISPLGSDEALSKAALKNKKKRINKKTIKDPSEPKQNPDEPGEDASASPPTQTSAMSIEALSLRSLKAGHHPSSYISIQANREKFHQQLPQRVRSEAAVDKSFKSATAATTGSPKMQLVPGSDKRANGAEIKVQAPPTAPTPTPAPAPAPVSKLDVLQQTLHAKKVRSLTKKIRAIEELEMRLAGGEKLEDTQMKKITTKKEVLRDLDALEQSTGGSDN